MDHDEPSIFIFMSKKALFDCTACCNIAELCLSLIRTYRYSIVWILHHTSSSFRNMVLEPFGSRFTDFYSYDMNKINPFLDLRMNFLTC